MNLPLALKDPQSPEWGDPPLPTKFITFRPAQVQAVQEIVARFESGVRVVVLESPTGGGKSLLAEMTRRALGERALYMCVDRGLQDQILNDFDYARVVKGRRNYPTLDYPAMFDGPEQLSCDDCTGNTQTSKCKWCASAPKSCPYRVVKMQAKHAKLACANTAYFLAECNGPGEFTGWPLIIADEGDRLESVLMSHVEVSIGERRLLEWGLRAPEQKIGVDFIPVVTTWLETQVLPKVTEAIEEIDPRSDDLRDRRRRRALVNLQDKLDALIDDLPKGGWVVETRRGGVVFKPVKVDHIAEKLLWAHGKRWLVMSATILNPARMLRDLGITESWAVVRMPSSFPVENRPIYAKAVANVTRKEEATALPLVAIAVQEILEQHPDERILVHAVSYALMEDLRRRLPPSPRLTWYEGADTRAGIIETYLSKPNGVLIAPALERGLDLPGDMCRVVVCAKVSWPSLGDAQVAARMALPGGQEWYTAMAIRATVQAVGRGMRSADDKCVTYLLDTQFNRLLSQHRATFPKWFLDAVVQ